MAGLSLTVEFDTDRIKNELSVASGRALEIIGSKAETYAKLRCPVGTPESTGKKGYIGGTLRDSITHEVDPDNTGVSIGSPVHYAPYVELGTGPYYETPPPWVQNFAPRGRGVGHSFVHPRPYIRPAFQDHTEEYRGIFESELKKGN